MGKIVYDIIIKIRVCILFEFNIWPESHLIFRDNNTQVGNILE